MGTPTLLDAAYESWASVFAPKPEEEEEDRGQTSFLDSYFGSAEGMAVTVSTLLRVPSDREIAAGSTDERPSLLASYFGDADDAIKAFRGSSASIREHQWNQ